MCRECFRHFQKYLELETKLKSNIQVAIRAGTATTARKKMREDCSGMSEPAVTIILNGEFGDVNEAIICNFTSSSVPAVNISTKRYFDWSGESGGSVK